ncbi:hypothetical protein MP228_010406 [Amoeboaphelidium protococcarum]|nr:hypothetical protein MP228_010406 [Amoeboaphelidium protococcarum]
MIMNKALDLYENILPEAVKRFVSFSVTSLMLAWVMILALFNTEKRQMNLISCVLSPFTAVKASIQWILREVFNFRDEHDIRSMRVYDYCKLNGYRCLDYIVTTDDGYQILLHRISPPLTKNGRRTSGGDQQSYDRRSSTDSGKHLSDRKYPVLLMHGLLQSAGVFVTNGKRSLAFYLVDQGFDVWLGNNRGVDLSNKFTKSPVIVYNSNVSKVKSQSDSDYWQYTMDDLACFDLPAIVDFVLAQSSNKVDKLHFVGHSQGNAQAYIALSSKFIPKSKFASFTAMAPAAFIGPLVKQWPLCLLIDVASDPQDTRLFRFFFRDGMFMPLFCFVQDILNASLFTKFSYAMFSFLFNWNDDMWAGGQIKGTSPVGSSQNHGNMKSIWKHGHFQFTPRNVGSRLILHWGQCASRGRLSPFQDGADLAHINSGGRPRIDSLDIDQLTKYGVLSFSDSVNAAGSQSSLDDLSNADVMSVSSTIRTSGKFASRSYDVGRLYDVPMLLFWGAKDYLVDANPLIKYLSNGARKAFRRKLTASTEPNILYQSCIDNYEHMDFMWAHNAEQTVWQPIVQCLTKLENQQ